MFLSLKSAIHGNKHFHVLVWISHRLSREHAVLASQRNEPEPCICICGDLFYAIRALRRMNKQTVHSSHQHLVKKKGEKLSHPLLDCQCRRKDTSSYSIQMYSFSFQLFLWVPFLFFFPSSAGWAMACSYETSVQLHNGPDFSLFEGQEGHAK